jgi:site-specific DNA recombinase
MSDKAFSQDEHKRAVLYARVSTSEQGSNYSLPTQAKACREYAEKNGMEVIAEFREDFTGSTPIEQRPEGGKAFAMLKSGQADCLIAYAMDRLSRSRIWKN